MTASDLIETVLEEFQKGQIYEAQILDDRYHIDGFLHRASGDITINPKVSVVDTVIHELLHRRYPKWTERKVKQETARIMGHLTPAEIDAWYRRYRRAAKKRGPVVY